MEKICCGLCGAPILQNVIIRIESEEGAVITIDGDGLFFSDENTGIAVSEEERTFLM